MVQDFGECFGPAGFDIEALAEGKDGFGEKIPLVGFVGLLEIAVKGSFGVEGEGCCFSQRRFHDVPGQGNVRCSSESVDFLHHLANLGQKRRMCEDFADGLVSGGGDQAESADENELFPDVGLDVWFPFKCYPSGFQEAEKAGGRIAVVTGFGTEKDFAGAAMLGDHAGGLNVGADIDASGENDAGGDDLPDPGVNIHAIEERENEGAAVEAVPELLQNGNEVKFFDGEETEIQGGERIDVIACGGWVDKEIGLAMGLHVQSVVFDGSEVFAAGNEMDVQARRKIVELAKLRAEVSADATNPHHGNVRKCQHARRVSGKKGASKAGREIIPAGGSIP